MPKRSARAPVVGGPRQSTLSFSTKVTKTSKSSGKDSVLNASTRKKQVAAPLSTVIVDTEVDEKAEVKPVEPTTESRSSKSQVAKADTEDRGNRDEEVALEEPEPEEKPAYYQRAENVSDAQIKAYLSSIESARKCKPIHQEALSEGEKVLRHWDVCSQYGPCIGSGRLQRWERAERLGLSPPIEVLAVLLKTNTEKPDDRHDRAHLDLIMNPPVIV